MHIILLPGNSHRNIEWMRAFQKGFAHVKATSSIVHCDGWHIDEDGELDMEREFTLLKQEVKKDPQHVICALSTGTLIALHAIHDKIITPVKCVFIGTTIVWGSDKKAVENQWLHGYSTPSLFIQNDHDPITSYAFLRRILQRNKARDYRMHELEGHKHVYDNINEIQGEVFEYIWGYED